MARLGWKAKRQTICRLAGAMPSPQGRLLFGVGQRGCWGAVLPGLGAACGPLRDGSRTPRGEQGCPPHRQRTPPKWRSDSPNASYFEITTYVLLWESLRHTATLPKPFWEAALPRARGPLPKLRHDGSQKVRLLCPKHRTDTTATEPQTTLPPPPFSHREICYVPNGTWGNLPRR